MTLPSVLLAAALASLIGALPPGNFRNRFLALSSVLAVYWLQPSSPIRTLELWLPAATLALTAAVWAVTCKGQHPLSRDDSQPDLAAGRSRRSLAGGLLAALLLAGLVILKTPDLAVIASRALRTLANQPAALAETFDIRWLGFSYLAFRLLHILRDAASGRLPAVSLRDFVVYALFPPALAAGPIDRLGRFAGDLNEPHAHPVKRVEALSRLVSGLVKKFVLADSLALISLSPANAAQVDGPWLWLLVYAYAFRIFFDFAGYTDIAIGLGMLLGIRLPENFNRPYLKPNLTAFWNAWHITLAEWFRSYFFNPLTRLLRRRNSPAWLAILAGQVSTMVLIGLWHGVSWNYLLWGAWHRVGLFVHNRWSSVVRVRYDGWQPAGWVKPAFHAAGVLATFHFVLLGWVWFALPEPVQSGLVLGNLLGARP